MTNLRTKKNRSYKNIIYHKKKRYSRLKKRGGTTTKKMMKLSCAPKKGKLMKYS